MEDVRRVTLFPRGVIEMPPSKSISHRALICAGLAEGESAIGNLASSEDIDATERCMRELRRAGGPAVPLDCGESGSTLRFLIPVAAALYPKITFTGRGRLMERPLGPYFEALAGHGARMELREGVLTLSGRLRPGAYRLPGDVSSQFVSGLLLALPLLDGDSEIQITTPLESGAYVDLTLDVMEHFGVRAANDGHRRFTVAGGQRYRARALTVEGDYSQAAFFLAAGALGCACECRGLSPGSRQGDGAITGILRQSGIQIRHTPQGGLAVEPGNPRAQTVDASAIPDLVPPLAAFFCFCEGESRIVNAGRLRHKESDRLAAVAGELRRLGADIAAEGDSLVIRGAKTLRGGRMSARGDHRIAMMGAVAAVRSEGDVIIEGAGCVAKSYPGFWRDFERAERGNRI